MDFEEKNDTWILFRGFCAANELSKACVSLFLNLNVYSQSRNARLVCTELL